MSDQQYKQLIEAAKLAQQRAYAPYSNFPVGAAVLTDSHEIFMGCNVENASYGLTICAERVALTSAVAAGHRNFTALAIVTNGIHTPCGACRQFMSEFNADLLVILNDANDESQREEISLSQLLPRSFHKS